MWKSVIYKEWIKVRWFMIIGLALGLLAVGYIFLKVQHDVKFSEAHNYWNLILFQGYSYFGYLKFYPALLALALAVSQFFPETVSKRIKLTFHLPINENKVLLMTMLFGTVCILGSFIVLLGLFLILSSIYFPIEIIWPALVAMLPWVLSGFAIYYMVALVVLEPVWKYRFLYILVAAAFIPLFYEQALPGGYGPANPILFVLVIILSVSLLFSGYRFRKGEM